MTINTIFNIQSLSMTHMDAFMALQERVYKALPSSDKLFIIQRTQEAVQKHFTNAMPAFGVMDGDRMIAATLAVYPNPDKMQNYVLACQSNLDINDLTIIESVYVCPDHRQKGLATTVAKTACQKAFAAGRPKIIAEIADGNIASIKTFEKIGFHKAGSYISPEDRCKVIMMGNKSYFQTLSA